MTPNPAFNHLPYRPMVPVPGSKATEAKRLLREGLSLAEVAERVGIPADILDRELWRLLGVRLDSKRAAS